MLWRSQRVWEWGSGGKNGNKKMMKRTANEQARFTEARKGSDLGRGSGGDNYEGIQSAREKKGLGHGRREEKAKKRDRTRKKKKCMGRRRGKTWNRLSVDKDRWGLDGKRHSLLR